MTRRALYAGSFDPFTRGHADIVTRGLALFDEVIVAIGTNEAKRNLFSAEERLAQISAFYAKEPRVRVVTYTGLTLTGAGAGNYRLNTATLTGTGKITPRTLTLTAAPQSIVQGEALPSFTGRADGFADGEDASVFGADGIAFGTAANTDTPGSYDITGRIGSVTGGVLGNYRIMQAAGNATAFTVHAALPSGILAALVQDAAPRFDTGFDQEVYVFGLPRPIPTATLGIYRFDAERAFEIQGLRL